MPFRSKAQQGFMFAKHPQIAKKWSKKYGVPKNLPKHVDKGFFGHLTHSSMQGNEDSVTVIGDGFGDSSVPKTPKTDKHSLSRKNFVFYK